MNNHHSNQTSSVRKVLGTYDANGTKLYQPSRLYGSGKKRKAPPKRISLDVTFFNYPGDNILTKPLIKESELDKLGTGSVQLFENLLEMEVKIELVNLLEQLTSTSLKVEDVILTFMKREGRKKEFRKHCCATSFKYDARGLKDMIGRDSKNITIVLGNTYPNFTPRIASPQIASTSTSTSMSTTAKANEYDDSSDASVDFPEVSFSKNTPKKSTPKSSLGSKRQGPVERPLLCKVPKKIVEHNKTISDLLGEASHSNVYHAVSDNSALLAVLTIMRHIMSFVEALNDCIEKKGINASELEHCLAQVMVLFENKDLNCWEIALTELASILKISPKDSNCGNIFGTLTKALRKLNCEVWKDFFLTPCLSSEMISEHCSSSGCERISTFNTDFIDFNVKEEISIGELVNNFTIRNKTKFPFNGYDIKKDDAVWNRKFFHVLPEILFFGLADIKDQRNFVFTEEIKKITLEDIRSFNDGIFNLSGMVCVHENNYVVVIRHSKNNKITVYANGNVYSPDLSFCDFVAENLSVYQKVFVMYSDLDHLEDNPNVEAIDVFGKFISERLSAKQAVRNNEIIAVDDESDCAEGEFKSMMHKLDGRLSSIKGQPELKKKIRLWARHVIMQNRKRELGVAALSKSEITSNLHMILSGNPGTGKTMVARCMAGILHDIGLLATSDIVEVQRDDLVSGFVCDTAIKTKGCIKKACGKLMFIDEAYQLCKKQSEKDFGKESLDTIMKFMSPCPDDSTTYPVFVFAGYSLDMDIFVKSVNRGFRRRIKERFEFKDYSPEELTRITTSNLLKKKWNYPYGVEQLITNGYSRIPMVVRSEHNASLCNDLIKEIVMQQETRLTFDATPNELISFTKEDIIGGISALLQRFKQDGELKFFEKSTQTPSSDVLLHIPGVGIIPGSPY